VEAIVVVASILLAFGIDAWWDGVRDHRRLGASLEEVLEDLTADSVELESSGDRARLGAELSLWAVENFGEPGVSADSAARALSGLFSQDPYQPVNSGYASLRESSQLGEIEDAALRSAIIAYYETIQTQHVWRHQVLMELQRDVWEAAELDLHVAADTAYDRFLGRRVELARPWAQIPSDARLPSRLRNFGSRAAGVELFTERIILENAALRSSIRGALRRP
jgi:hypothetical protein